MVVSILLVLLVAFSVVKGWRLRKHPPPNLPVFWRKGMMGGRGQRSQSGTYGTGMMGRGMMGGSGRSRVYMVQALADELGLKSRRFAGPDHGWCGLPGKSCRPKVWLMSRWSKQ